MATLKEIAETNPLAASRGAGAVQGALMGSAVPLLATINTAADLVLAQNRDFLNSLGIPEDQRAAVEAMLRTKVIETMIAHTDQYINDSLGRYVDPKDQATAYYTAMAKAVTEVTINSLTGGSFGLAKAGIDYGGQKYLGNPREERSVGNALYPEDKWREKATDLGLLGAGAGLDSLISKLDARVGILLLVVKQLVSNEASKAIQGTSTLSFANSAADGIKYSMAPAAPAPVDDETREAQLRWAQSTD